MGKGPRNEGRVEAEGLANPLGFQRNETELSDEGDYSWPVLTPALEEGPRQRKVVDPASEPWLCSLCGREELAKR